MCVIIYKPQGVKMPNDYILELAAISNRDGFGYVSTSNSGKYLNFDTFYNDISQIDTDENILMHFRYATHGSICVYNCHPFCNSNKDIYFMHNGVLPVMPMYDKTDSEIVFVNKFLPIIAKYGYNSKQLDKAVKNIIGTSKFAFMHNNDVKLYGNYEMIDGVYFSNLRFLPYGF